MRGQTVSNLVFAYARFKANPGPELLSWGRRSLAELLRRNANDDPERQAQLNLLWSLVALGEEVADLVAKVWVSLP